MMTIENASINQISVLTTRAIDIPHVNTLRIHTRIPIVLPERIDSGLLDVLSHRRLSCVVVLHANHPNELNDDVKKACDDLKKIGVFLLNQSVLLKDVNDDAYVLVCLSKKLFQFGILPYYLHVLDKVQGAQHFERSDEDAKQLFRAMQISLPGYLVPRLMREMPGALSKSLVGF